MLQVPSTDGVTLAVHDLGGEGDPLLLCHATGFCGMAYAPLAHHLVREFHVMAIDFRGHGDSTSPENERFHWAGMADDLLAAIDAVTDQPITVFGHSLGGGVAVLGEARRPGTLRAAYLFEPIVPPAIEGRTDANPNIMGDTARRRRPSFASKADALWRYASRPPLDQLRADALMAYVEHGFEQRADGTAWLKCTPEHEALTFEADGKPDLAVAATVTTPTTIAIGTLEADWTPAMFGPAVADVLPNGRLEQHPTLGHFGPLQEPVAIAAGIIESAHA